MKLLTPTLVLAIGTLATAADKETAETLAAKLKTTEQTLRLTQVEVNLQKIERMKSEASRLNSENMSLLSEACKIEGLDPDKNCEPDLVNKKVNKKQYAVPDKK